MKTILSTLLLSPFERGYQIGMGVGTLLAIGLGIWYYFKYIRNKN
ncbi:MAG TPA: hypothetical protein VK177_15675 [Flavobacteriales bacterium]|nr:hypothetical protein [Flavobacteriales bacterium]